MALDPKLKMRRQTIGILGTSLAIVNAEEYYKQGSMKVCEGYLKVLTSLKMRTNVRN